MFKILNICMSMNCKYVNMFGHNLIIVGWLHNAED